jgi:tellurite resistance protein TehA-like permease
VNQTVTLAQLRELFLENPDLEATRWLALSISVLLIGVVLWLVRRRKLREEYTPIWVAISAGLVFVSIRLDLLRELTRAIGAWTPSSTVFFLGELFLVAICLNYAVRLSRAGTQIKNLAQELAILRARVDAVAARQPDARAPAART